MAEDTRHLVTRGETYWLQLATPRPLHDRIRRKVIQRSLGTKSLAEAKTERWIYVNGYKAAWEKALAEPTMTREEIEELAAVEIERERKRQKRI